MASAKAFNLGLQVSNSLVAIASRFYDIDRMLIESAGEMTPEIQSFMDLAQGDMADKIDNYKLYIEHLESRAEYFASIERQAYAAAALFKNQVKRMKDNLKTTALQIGTSDLLGNDYRFKVSTSKPKLKIDNAEAIPVKFMEEIISFVPNKGLIEMEIADGKEVPGCKMESTISIRDYVNTKGSK